MVLKLFGKDNSTRSILISEAHDTLEKAQEEYEVLKRYPRFSSLQKMHFENRMADLIELLEKSYAKKLVAFRLIQVHVIDAEELCMEMNKFRSDIRTTSATMRAQILREEISSTSLPLGSRGSLVSSTIVPTDSLSTSGQEPSAKAGSVIPNVKHERVKTKQNEESAQSKPPLAKSPAQAISFQSAVEEEGWLVALFPEDDTLINIEAQESEYDRIVRHRKAYDAFAAIGRPLPVDTVSPTKEPNESETFDTIVSVDSSIRPIPEAPPGTSTAPAQRQPSWHDRTLAELLTPRFNPSTTSSFGGTVYTNGWVIDPSVVYNPH